MYKLFRCDCDSCKLAILLIANDLQSMYVFLQGVFSEIICKAGAFFLSLITVGGQN